MYSYSDGSSEGSGRSSWAHIFQREETTSQMGSGVLHVAKICDAEIFGATFAFRPALSLTQNSEKIFVLLGNQVAVIALQIRKSISYVQLTRIFHHLATSVSAEHS